MTRVRVAGTVDSAVAIDFDKAVEEYQLQAKKLQEKDPKTPIPTQSDLLHEVIKKGLKQIRKQNSTTQPCESIT